MIKNGLFPFCILVRYTLPNHIDQHSFIIKLLTCRLYSMTNFSPSDGYFCDTPLLQDVGQFLRGHVTLSPYDHIIILTRAPRVNVRAFVSLHEPVCLFISHLRVQSLQPTIQAMTRVYFCVTRWE